MKYAIIGAGGTGGTLGFYLTKAGKDVTLIARGSHLEAMQKQGLTMRQLWDGKEETIPVKACRMEEYTEQPDVILVCVKGYFLTDLIPDIRRIAGPETVVLSILNIYGTGGRLQKEFPDLTVPDGCIYVSAAIEEPGVILRHGKILRVVFGARTPSEETESMRAIARDMASENLEVILSPDIRRDAIKLPENVVTMYRNLLQPDKQGYYVRNNHFEGLMFALKNAALMVTMTESADLGVAVSSNALELAGSTEEEVYLYFYDCYVGGLGFAEKIYDLIPKVVEQAVRMVSGCRCKNGCAVCIGDDRLDRNVILWGLQNLSEESGFAGMISLPENQEEQTISKEFKFAELGDKWNDFCSRITERNEAFAGFFRMVSSIEVKGDSLIFYVKEAFYAEWADMPENRNAIVNILLRYVSVPDGFRLAILSGEKIADHDKKEKMMRRYHSLKKDENDGIK